ncbi:MAG: CDP-alcohol phosphatidyltransferase, partial [Thermaerobacter sp.]
GGAWLPLLAGFLALAGAPLSALVKDRLQWLAGSGRRYNPLRDDPAWLRWLPVNRDGRCLVILLCGLAGAPVAALLILALASHVGAWARVVHGLQRLQARS